MNLLAAIIFITIATAESTHSNHDDDHRELVREVIEENPPRAQGIRPEWGERVGWHRKEHIEDDEHLDLVREVIGENPPEVQGIRPEWEGRVGWYRKEDIYNKMR